jgi:hypothetical protein
MKNTLLKLSLFLPILVSACSASNRQTASPTVDPILTAILTQTPTETISSPTAAVTVVIQTPTKDFNALLSQLLPNCSEVELSPNRTWATGICNKDETWVVNVDQQEKWTVSYDEYYGKKFDSDKGTIEPYHWSSDNKVLDLAIQPAPFFPTIGGAYGSLFYHDGWGLVRLDLANGNLADILKPNQQYLYSFSFSPDGKSLAYIPQPAEPLALNVMDLESKKVKNYMLKPEYNQAGDILWSPNMSKLVLGQAFIDPNEPGSDVLETKPSIFSVGLIDLTDNSRQLVISDNSLFTRPVKWLDENRIELLDEDANYWIYNLTDQTLVKVSP